MKILVLGASGYAGACIKKVLKKGFESVLGTYRTWKEEYRADSTMLQLELGGARRLREVLNQCRPNVVISCVTGDFFQQMEAHKLVAEYLAAQGEGKLIYLSTANIGTRDLREYTAFLRERLQALGLQPPAFQVEECGGPLYQAVLPSRKDIPDYLQFDVADVIAYLVKNRPAVG